MTERSETRRGTAAVVAGMLGMLAAAQAATAVLPPESYEAARREAAHHLQMRIEDVRDLPWYSDHGACAVAGRVVRVFRGDHNVGERMTFDVDCAKPRARLQPGPQLWTSWRALKDAEVIEAYLDVDDSVMSWQTMLLSTPTDEPACPEDQQGPC